MNNAAPTPALPAAPHLFVSDAAYPAPLQNVARQHVTAEDLVAARKWRMNLEQHAHAGHIRDSPKTLAEADAYVTKLECLYAQVPAPASVTVEDVLGALANLTKLVQDCHRDVLAHTANTSLVTVGELGREARKSGRLAAISYNLTCGDGSAPGVPFAVVPNAAGKDPTDREPALPNLPPIKCTADIHNLSHVQLLGYCNFYGVDPDGPPGSIVRGIEVAIGVAEPTQV